MAKNSIFATLLRSPWWVSLIVALIVASVARYLLAGFFGMAIVSIAFPFLVISAMAGWREWNTPSTAQIEATVKAVSEMSWQEFSSAMQQAYEREGYVVKRTNGAADLLLQKEGRLSLVFCKRWKAASHGPEPLLALQAAHEAQDTQRAIYVATGGLTDKARRIAKENGIVLLEAPELTQLLKISGRFSGFGR